MRLLRSLPQLAFALVLVSIVGLCIAQRSVWLLLGAGAIAVASRPLTEGPFGRSMPRGIAVGMFIALAAYAMFAVVREGVPWITVLGHFTLGVTLIKLYEQRTVRDWGHLLVFSMLMMIIGTVQSADLLFGVVAIAYATLGLYVLLLFQLYAAHEQAKATRRAQSPRGYRLVPPVKPTARRHVAGHLRRLGAAIALGGLLVSAVVFVLMPRGVGRDVVPGLRRLGADARAGFSDHVDLRTGQRITSRQRPVMEVVFDDPGPAGPLRLRGAVLDTYLGEGRWRSTPGMTALVQTHPPVLTPFVASTPGRVATFRVDPFKRQSVLFSPLRPVAVTTESAEPLRLDPATAVLRHPGGARRHAYTIRAMLEPPEAERVGPGRPGDLTRLLDPRVRALAVEVLAEGDMPLSAAPDVGAPERGDWNRAAATLLDEYLRTRYSYTLDLSDVVDDGIADEDPVFRFLLDTRRGHCEYFASALAAMCANLEVPVRVVTGYVAYPVDAGRFIVLESNAHAWCEVRTGADRWSTFDPTPPSTLRDLHAFAPTLADRLAWQYERFEGSWQAGVVRFDRRSQQALGERLYAGWGETVLDAWPRVRAWTDQVNRAFRLGPAGYIWLGVVAFAVVLAVLTLVRFLRRVAAVRRALGMTRRHDGGARRMVRQLGFYLDMLAMLERAGIGKPPARPPRLHALSLQAAGSPAGGIVEKLTDRYYASRYGGRALSREQLVETAGLLDDLASVLGLKR